MSKIAIVADSTCDIPPNLLEKYGIYIVPLHLLWGQDDLLDGPDISAASFYDRLMTDPRQPTTSAPSIGEFVEVFKQAQADGAEEIVVFTLSQGMSSTYNTAQMAANSVDIPITLHDTASTSMASGWQVLRAAQVRDAGSSVADIIAAAQTIKDNSVVLLCVDTLEYLHRGGRIGGAAKWIGSMLDAKPLLWSNLETGMVEPLKTVLTWERAVETLFETFFQRAGAISQTAPLHVAVIHAASEDEAEMLAKRIRQREQTERVLISPGSPVLGMHTGPGTLALCGYVELK